MQTPGRKPPNLEQLAAFRTNRPGAVEVIWQPKYDFQTYALAGTTTQYTYFQTPVGQSSKTFADTNMEAAGQMPAPKTFLVTAIQVVMFPLMDVSAFGAQAVAEFSNDVYDLGKAGYLKFFVGSKDYLTDAPIGKFACEFSMSGFAALADQSTIAASLQSRISYSSWRGPKYAITPIMLERNMNFNVTLNFPSTTAVSANVRLGVILDGYEYRNSQ